MIYRAMNRLTGKSYIGQSIEFEKRKTRHLYDASTGVDFKFYRSIRVHGEDAFEWTILASGVEEDRLDDLEIFYIAQYKTYTDGYNGTEGGGGFRGCDPSPETRAKISAALSGREKSAEHIAKNAAAHRGLKLPPRSEEWKAKITKANTGRAKSPETRAKISKSLTGRTLTADHVANARAGLANMSEEARAAWGAKLSAAAKDRKKSPEQIANMRKAWVERKRKQQEVQPK